MVEKGGGDVGHLYVGSTVHIQKVHVYTLYKFFFTCTASYTFNRYNYRFMTQFHCVMIDKNKMQITLYFYFVAFDEAKIIL